MPELQAIDQYAEVGSSVPVVALTLVAIGRGPADPELRAWVPANPKEGDVAYAVIPIGVFHGTWGEAGGFFVETNPTAELPAKLAAELLKMPGVAAVQIEEIHSPKENDP